MKKIKLIVLKPYFLFLSFICIFLLLSSFKLGAFNSSSITKQVDFPVISLIPNLTVVKVKAQKYNALLLLRNDSNKAVTAISLTSSGVNYRSEMIGTDEIVAPGAMYLFQCGLPSSSSPEKGITIRAVVYEDGASEGEPEFIRQIVDTRAGTQVQLARILSLLNDLSRTSSSVSFNQKKQSLKDRFRQLPETEERKSFEFGVGLHDVKESVIHKLNQLEKIQQEKGEDISRHALSQLIADYNKKSLSISNTLKRVR